MQHEMTPIGITRSETHLLALCGLVAISCVAFVPATPGPYFFEIPEVIVPLGISLGLSLYTVRLRRQYRPFDTADPLLKYVWSGALGSATIGIVWTGLHHYYGLPVDVLPDELLTVLSVGIAAGVFLGQSTVREQRFDRSSDRTRVLGETSWTNRSGPSPILEAVVETLAEVGGVDPVELEPLYDSVDPDAFSQLRSGDDSQWQLLFYVDEYEVRVSSHGTVTVYGTDAPNAPPPRPGQ